MSDISLRQMYHKGQSKGKCSQSKWFTMTFMLVYFCLEFVPGQKRLVKKIVEIFFLKKVINISYMKIFAFYFANGKKNALKYI